MFLDYKLERDEGNCKSPRLDTRLKKTLIDDEGDVAHLVEEPGWVFKDTQRCPKIRVELLRVKVIYLKGYLSPHQGHEKLTQTAKWNFFLQIF